MQQNSITGNEITLTSPADFPFHFTIHIKQATGNAARTCIVETNDDAVTTSTKSHTYLIENTEHDSYLDLFQNLAKDFGLRMPQNRLPPTQHQFNAPYPELLKNNLVPEMLYGYGDPALLRVTEQGNTWYYMVATSNDAPNSFPICRSTDLEHWEFVSFVFPRGNKPPWAADGERISDYWAPEMHLVGGEFRIYFVARAKDTLELCIGVARSPNPAGPYRPDDHPMLKGDTIDPHVFVQDEQTAFLYWKEDNNAIWPTQLVHLLCTKPSLIKALFSEKQDQLTASFIATLQPWIDTLKPMEAFFLQQNLIEAITNSFHRFKQKLTSCLNNETGEMQNAIHVLMEAMRTPIYAQKLSPDGSSLIGDKSLIIENDQPWEAHLVEGPWVMKQGDKVYLFYSGNDFSTDQYGIGVAVADSALGPFTKVGEPILKSTEKWWAPGHPSVATGPGGKPQLFLHAYFPNEAGYKKFRALLTVELQFNNGKVSVK